MPKVNKPTKAQIFKKEFDVVFKMTRLFFEEIVGKKHSREMVRKAFYKIARIESKRVFLSERKAELSKQIEEINHELE